MNTDKMASNIISGFEHTGLYPFDPNNVDYSKIILRIEKENINTKNDHQIKSHLKFIEQNIDNDLLTEFKRALRVGYEWDGDVKATMFYELWSNINKNQTIEEPLTPTDTSNINDFTLPLNINNLIASPSTSQLVTIPSPQVNYAPSTSHTSPNINPTPWRCLESVFDDVIKWPVPQQSKNKRKKEYLPSVITSDKWVEYYKLKELEKLNKETQKLNKKKASLEKKKIENAKEREEKKKILNEDSNSDSELAIQWP